MEDQDLPGSIEGMTLKAAGDPPGSPATGPDGLSAPQTTTPSGRVDVQPKKPPVSNPNKSNPHPLKPKTNAQLAEFVALWNDPEFTVGQIARRYQSSEATVRRWRLEYGLPERNVAIKDSQAAEGIMALLKHQVPGGPAAKDAEVVGTPPNAKIVGPLEDKEITDLLADIRSEARIMSPHSDLTPIQRKLAKLNVLVATKRPMHSWASISDAADGLARALLHTRRVEAEIPRGDADPIMLRKEAATQMMRELRSVLTPEEQATLATIVKAGADRLIAKGGGAPVLADDLETGGNA